MMWLYKMLYKITCSKRWVRRYVNLLNKRILKEINKFRKEYNNK